MMENIGVQPYMFEPVSDDDEDEDFVPQPIVRRLDMNVSEWCTCGNCARMTLETELVCCREIPQVTRRMSQVPEEISCMTDHPGLEPVCLNLYSLQNAMNVYRADHGRLRLRGMERQCRYLAYRWFVSWCWGFLGRSVRVVIPSCVVLRIRREFPNAAGQYVGFRPPLD
ncbi:P2X purinoceptor 7-like [Misgurnus anguillicaudatus]|uniref:P2X purinoceptor 7-like n=1 Tax=Misgurnus anguillicaudatus TaxID=75329 RepID=UPI00243554E8|nr:P2X purinoceptor 7-like [Misgurnus anguillicaudatus]XP_055062147.1 P2X purinoceptor 7-like [Misgurnus anguillicaudatus]